MTATPTAPIQAADGTLPYNGYLWPTESWWLGHEHPRFDSRWHFGYVALMDGRFAVDGLTWHIQDDCAVMRHGNDKETAWHRKRNNFPTRTAAIRAAAARMILVMRAARTWEGGYSLGSMKGERLAFAINWTLSTVARVTQGKPHRTVRIPDPAPPAPATAAPFFEGVAVRTPKHPPTMTTLDLLRLNFRETNRRDAYPATAADLPLLAAMEPLSIRGNTVLLNVSGAWEMGKVLHYQAQKIGGAIFLRLVTRDEHLNPGV